ncbi:hypothetical protein HWC21_gp170 [Vibrio phage VAP7]|uniref:Uncharacterized protein n=1 Tax=Vibrio phage VAP7 TaxID=2584487 RepID=A0A4Y5TVG2_9CAUD|nr:hypothetical protein HWC21_gp170 [Vibrio phage VAP7]QDB73352.1 hypothetical protein [Vibrio phage VAP7]UFD98156.1 hypothetical protein [Vibrio phage BX-1]
MLVKSLSQSEFKKLENHNEVYQEAFRVLNAHPWYSRSIVVVPKEHTSIIYELAGQNGYVVEKDKHFDVMRVKRGGFEDGHKPTRPEQTIFVMTEHTGDLELENFLYEPFEHAVYDNKPGDLVILGIKKDCESWNLALTILDEMGDKIYFNKLR